MEFLKLLELGKGEEVVHVLAADQAETGQLRELRQGGEGGNQANLV